MSPWSNRRVLWTEAETQTLFALAAEGHIATEIARMIGRSPQSVHTKANKLGIRLEVRNTRFPIPQGEPESWDEAQRICAFANVPLPLAQLVVDVSDRRNIAPRNLRSDSRLPHLVDCRREISVIARSQGYSLPLIGRALNRDHTTILHAIRSEAMAA